VYLRGLLVKGGQGKRGRGRTGETEGEGKRRGIVKRGEEKKGDGPGPPNILAYNLLCVNGL